MYRPDEAAALTKEMVGHNLVTKQTPAEGKEVSKVMIAESIDIKREMYFAILLDRAYNGPVIVASTKGGVDIEEVAETNPDAILKVPVSIKTGPTDKQTQELAEKLEFESEEQIKDVQTQINNLYKMFIDLECTQCEINPLAETTEGESMCICMYMCVYMYICMYEY